MRALKNDRGFVMLLELLAVLAIIGILAYFMMKRVSGPPRMDKETQKAVAEQGVDTSNYRSIVDSTRNTLKGVTEKEQQQLDQVTKEEEDEK
jgi:type II secretory pathway pseudopilin PulG